MNDVVDNNDNDADVSDVADDNVYVTYMVWSCI